MAAVARILYMSQNKKSHVGDPTWLLSCYPNFFQDLQRLPSSTAAGSSALGFAVLIIRRVCRPLAVTLAQLFP